MVLGCLHEVQHFAEDRDATSIFACKQGFCSHGKRKLQRTPRSLYLQRTTCTSNLQPCTRTLPALPRLSPRHCAHQPPATSPAGYLPKRAALHGSAALQLGLLLLCGLLFKECTRSSGLREMIEAALPSILLVLAVPSRHIARSGQGSHHTLQKPVPKIPGEVAATGNALQ